MATAFLNSTFPAAEISIVHSNEDYGFNIALYKPISNDYCLLVTDGLRNHLQAVNEDNNDLTHIELYMCLPEYWNFEINPWPIHWLNRIAQVPQKNDTWFGHGDTIPAGNPPAAIDNKFKANHFMISRPIFFKSQFSNSPPSLVDHRLLAVIPLFPDEIKFKLKNSHTMLLNKLEKAGIDERIDIYRVNVCKKWRFNRR